MMGESEQPLAGALRRIAVVLDTAGSTRRLLELLPLLLRDDERAEIRAIFVQDTGLERLAALPFARELSRLTWAARQPRPGELERMMSVRARATSRALETLATRLGVGHSFHSVTGTLAGQLLDAVRASDLTLIGPGRPSLGELPGTSAHMRARRRVVVALDEEKQAPPARAVHALAAGLLLAGGDSARVTVLVPPGSRAGFLAEHARRSEGGKDLPSVHLEELPEPGLRSVFAAVRRERAAALVLSAGSSLSSSEAMETLHQLLRCPACLVR